MSFIPTEYSDPIFVYSLRNVFPRYGGPLVRVIRESDHIEGDVYPDDNGEVSYDSTIIVNPSETSALVLGEFLNIDGYTDADGLGEVYEGRLSKIYDQSAGSFDVGVDTYSVSFLFVETNLPAYGGSTAIHKVNGVPAFFATATQPMFKLAQARGREVSYHFMTEGVGATQYFGFIDWATSYRIWGLHDIEAEITSATLFPTQQWDINAIYFDSELGDNSFVSNVYSSETFNNFGSVITTVEAQLLDTATTQTAFPDNEITFNVMSNNWYCDIVAFDGYDPIRRITIEQLYAQSASNTTAFARTSSLLIDNENPNQSGFLAQFPNAAAAYSVRSLTGNTGTDGPKIVRVRRAVDNIEVDVYTDNSGWVSLDSPIENVYETTINTVNREYISLATTLGEFVADPSYNNPDNITTTTATVSAWYDQSKVNTNLLPLQISDDEAAAAYSVRLLNPEYNGPLLKVRRSSDNVTKDIYPNANGELDVDDIEQFIQDGVMGPDYTEEYLLDIIPDGETEAPQAAAAYSLRKLKASYTGPLVRVRRTDGIEVDVYPQQDGWFGLESPIENVIESPVEEGDFGGVLTFKYFAQNDNITVVTWYDQSGTLNDATQDVTGNQPTIFTGGAVVTENGKPAVEFNGTNHYLETGNNLGYTGYPLFETLVASSTNDGIATSLLDDTSDRNYVSIQPYFDPNETISSLRDVSINTILRGSASQQHSLYTLDVTTTSSVAFYRNGLLVDSTSGTLGSPSNSNNFLIGKLRFTGPSFSYFAGTTQEAIVYLSDQSTNRTGIEDNINNAFSIYGGWEATVETWYDQSGNGNDASQSDTNAQPTIASGGVVIRENGKPAVILNSSHMILPLSSAASDYTLFTVHKRNDNNDSYLINVNSTTLVFDGRRSNLSRGVYYDGQWRGNEYTNTTQAITTIALIATNSGASYLNGVETNSSLPYTQKALSGVISLGGSVGAQQINGSLQELILYFSNQSDNRPLIEKSINSYYNIYAQDAAIQNVSTAQPTIYNGGLITENGKPILQTDAGAHLIGTVDGSMKVFGVGKVSRTSMFLHYGGDVQGWLLVAEDGSTADYKHSTINVDALNLNGAPYAYASANRDLIYDDFSVHHLLYVSYTTVKLNLGLGYSPTPSQYPMWNQQEFIAYPSTSTHSVSDIESNINSAFQIYAANFSSVLDSVPLAKAAYSIRRLTKNYIGPIITVTNGSTTKDFYADFWGNLDVDALTSFANGGTLSVTKWWDQSGEGVHLLTTSTRPTLTIANNEVSVNTTNKFYEPLLDRYEDAAAAYSLRILKGDYTGPLVRVRRDVTNTEVDVYPDENLTISLNSPVLNVAEATTDVTASPQDTSATTLGEFVADAGNDPDGLGATVSAFVVVWYDQANSNNASQDISTDQPKIYDSATGVVMDNGKPAVEFDGTNDGLNCATDLRASTGASTVIMTRNVPTINEIQNPFAFYTVQRHIIDDLSGPYEEMAITTNNTTNFIAYQNANLNQQAVFFSSWDGATQVSGVDEVVLSINASIEAGTAQTVVANVTPAGTNSIGYRHDTNSQFCLGKIQELLVYLDDQSSNRTEIEGNINNHYQIPNFNATASTAQTVAVYNNAINTTVDLNATYTDLKEIIKYE